MLPLLLHAAALADCARTNVLLASEPGVPVVEVTFGRGGVPQGVSAVAGTAPPLATAPGTVREDGFLPLPGHRYLAIVEPHGHVLGCGGALDLGLPEEAAAAALWRAWLAADPDARAALAVDAPGDGLARELALGALGSRPDLLARVTPKQVARLVAATTSVVDSHSDVLSWVHARLGATEAVPLWLDWLERPHPGASTRPVLEALRVLTNHDPPGYVVGRDLYGDDLARVRADFGAWWARWKDDPARGVDAGFADRRPDDPLTAMVRRGRCEIARSLGRTALPAAGAEGPADPACP